MVSSEDEPIPGDELSQDVDGELSRDDEDEQPTRRFISVGPAGSSSGRLVVAEYEPTFIFSWLFDRTFGLPAAAQA